MSKQGWRAAGRGGATGSSSSQEASKITNARKGYAARDLKSSHPGLKDQTDSEPGSRQHQARTLSTKNEINRSAQAAAGPQVIQPDRLLHVENGKRNEDGQRDDLLQDLQLPQAHLRMPDAIG